MKKIVILLLTIFTISGCSTKFAYKNIDWLIYWYIDDYIEFTNEQETIFDEKLQRWLIWHKSQELPKYLAHIDELTADIRAQKLSIERMQYHQEKARDHWKRLRNHVVPDIVEMSFLLDDEQVVFLFAALEKDNKEDAEEIAERNNKSPEERRKDWLKRSKENLSEWIGKLTDEQKEYVANSYETFLPTREYWIEYKTNYQRALRELFANRHKDEAFDTKLSEMLINPEQYRSEAFNQASAHNEKRSREYLMTLLELSTEKQRQELIEQINKYREDIEDLAN